MNYPPSAHALRLVRSNLGWQPGQAHFEPVWAGRHVRVFKVSSAGSESVALKEYAPDFRTTLTLQREFAGLRLLERFSTCPCVPKALHQDADHGVALFEWKDGSAISPVDRGEDVFDPFVDFLASCAKIPPSELPGWAPDAARSGAHLETSLHQRLERIPLDHPVLKAWIETKFLPALYEFAGQSRRASENVLDWDQELPLGHRILAPSHLGFPDVIETTSRQIVFLTFSKFGQDDPAALLAQILHQSSHTATPDQKARLIPKFFGSFGSDPLLGTRFSAWFPLVGLQHTLDSLEVFCPMDRALRDFAGMVVRPKEEALILALERADQSLEALRMAISEG